MTAALVIACIALTIALVCSLVSRHHWKDEAEFWRDMSGKWKQSTNEYREMVMKSIKQTNRALGIGKGD